MPTGGNAADGGDSVGPMAYFVDSMFRTGSNTASLAAGTEPAAADPALGQRAAGAQETGVGAAQSGSNRAASGEVARIFAYGFQSGALSPEDTQYVGNLIAQRTGMAAADAEKKVATTFAQIQAKAKATETAARDAADKARRAASLAALWLFVALLAGAFVASFAATFGGRLRDT